MSRIERAEFLADRSIRLAPWVALLVAWNLVGYDVVTSLDVQQVVQLVVSAVLVAFLLRAVMRPRAKVHATPAAGAGVAPRPPGPARIAPKAAGGRRRGGYRDGGVPRSGAPSGKPRRTSPWSRPASRCTRRRTLWWPTLLDAR